MLNPSNFSGVIMNELSAFLYSRPSFFEGVSRLLDFGGTIDEYNCPRNGEQADLIASWADWTVVGNDMRSAWHEHINQLNQVNRPEQITDVQTLQEIETASRS